MFGPREIHEMEPQLWEDLDYRFGSGSQLVSCVNGIRKVLLECPPWYVLFSLFTPRACLCRGNRSVGPGGKGKITKFWFG